MTTIDLTTERIGRRTYIRGNTFAIKDDIKAAGGHWDADARAWWIGDDSKAQALVNAVQAAPPKTEATGSFRKLADDTWGVRGQNLVAGGTVTIFKADKSRVKRTVKAILSTDGEGWQTASLEPEQRPNTGVRYTSAGGGSRTPANWRPCGYPGCSPSYCDECDGEGLRSTRRW